MERPNLNPYENTIVRNADWFIARQSREGYIDAEDDEFYGIRGDATLVGHSVNRHVILDGTALGRGPPQWSLGRAVYVGVEKSI